MGKKVFLAGLSILLHFVSLAQTDTIARRIVLIGDAGQLTDGRHPVVDAVRNNITLDNKTTILFLGDNLYKVGLPDSEYVSYKIARSVLDSQVSIADKPVNGKKAKVWMIPGNHDWQNGGRSGYDAIVRQQLYVDFLKKDNVKFEPEDGCPGPVKVNIGDSISIILFDSQWWLHPHDKPGIESDCKCKTKDELVTQIQDLATRDADNLLIVASHHPFKSNGPHGGFFTLKQHLFPLTDLRKNLYIPMPLLGSVYPIARSVFGAPQDLKHPDYVDMITRVTEAIDNSLAPNVVFVSGHEHNLQHIKDDKYNYIVSGGGCKQSRTSKSKNSLYNSPKYGFAVLEVSVNKNVNLSFYTVTDSVRKDYSEFILNYRKPFAKPLDSTDASVVLGNQVSPRADSTTKPATEILPPIKGLKKYFMGQNYRHEWSAPVKMKVLDLSKEKGGLKIESLGGGTQTRSLRLVDKSGKEWVLRTVYKNTARAIPESFREKAGEVLMPEINSSAHPYGALVVPSLAKAIDITTASPELFFVPDDSTNLGFYRLLFANTVCMLEARNAALNDAESKTTSKTFSKILEDNDHRPDQEAVLKARLLDMLIGDFDRHMDQWRWGTNDTGKGKLYYPIPRDRDQAFFYSNGKTLRWISSRSIPFLKGFQKDIPFVEWLNYSARDFDRVFLTGLGKEQWETTIDYFKKSMTDSVIQNAVKKLPPEIYAINGQSINNKLTSRREEIRKAALRYYKFISRRVNVIGSNQKEYFKVSNHGQGLEVKVYEKGRGGDTSFVMYNRIFDPSVTKEIRLFGLNDDDVFEIEENAASRIKIRIIGGKGNDTFDIRGNVENLIYDVRSDLNFVKNKSRTKDRFSTDIPVNETSIFGFQYNRTKFPQLLFSFNSDDGYMTGIGFSKRTHGFRNLPYASDQHLSALYAINRKALNIRYRGEFNHITRNIDLVVEGNYLEPALRNFTGLGNKTKVNSDKEFNFYRSRYHSFEMEALFRKRYFEKLHFLAGPYFYRYWSRYEDNVNSILGTPRQIGLDSLDVYSNKSYIGAKLAMQFDNRNDRLVPTRGIFWNNEIVATAGSGTGSSNFTKFTSDLSIHASFKDEAKFVMVLAVGGGHIFSKNYEYFQALSLGVNNPNIHGFRKNRYSGSSLLYGSFEVRIKLFDLNSYILPGPVGITGFYDVGRVWLKNEESKKYHNAVGGGVYFIPFNSFIISATAGFSGNERLLNFNIGTKINLTF